MIFSYSTKTRPALPFWAVGEPQGWHAQSSVMSQEEWDCPKRASNLLLAGHGQGIGSSARKRRMCDVCDASWLSQKKKEKIVSVFSYVCVNLLGYYLMLMLVTWPSQRKCLKTKWGCRVDSGLACRRATLMWWVCSKMSSVCVWVCVCVSLCQTWLW